MSESLLTWQHAPFNIAWQTYKVLSPDLQELHPRLITLLDALDAHVAGRLFVHRTWSGGGGGGQHPLGTAFDGRIIGHSVLAQFIEITRFPWGGVGLYGPDVWHNPGFHVDVREVPGDRQARWACRMRAGVRVYEGLTEEYLRGIANGA